MTNRERLEAALKTLPPTCDDQGMETPVYADTPCIKVFTPDAGATWFLALRDEDMFGNDPRYFGLCDLGLGFPELGYVDHQSLTKLLGPFGLPVELDTSWHGTIGDGYLRVGLDIPSWLRKKAS